MSSWLILRYVDMKHERSFKFLVAKREEPNT